LPRVVGVVRARPPLSMTVGQPRSKLGSGVASHRQSRLGTSELPAHENRTDPPNGSSATSRAARLIYRPRPRTGSDVCLCMCAVSWFLLIENPSSWPGSVNISRVGFFPGPGTEMRHEAIPCGVCPTPILADVNVCAARESMKPPSARNVCSFPRAGVCIFVLPFLLIFWPPWDGMT
jgi:hypothetical protein